MISHQGDNNGGGDDGRSDGNEMMYNYCKTKFLLMFQTVVLQLIHKQ